VNTAALIRTARQSEGLTQHALALRVGTSQAAIARYETGVSIPRADTLDRVLEACGKAVATRSVPAAIVPIPRGGPIGRLVSMYRQEIREAGKKISAKPLLLFGSVARGEETPESDLDILVELPTGSDPLATYDLGAELEALLKVHVDVLSTRVARPEVLEQALRDAVPV
jgi:predicted nucleotidyltransferase/DNA-binding XRE family transcriptional regulator